MIDVANVENVFVDCSFRADEIENGKPKDESKMIEIEGLASKFGLHIERLEAHRKEVIGMFAQLPKEFHRETGGGHTFLNMCNTKDGVQWTSEQRIMELLLVLGIGLNMAGYCMPREMWNMFPGGVPYVWVE